MLNKKNRLQKNSSFIATYHQNRVVSDEFFILYAGKDKFGEYETKFGFVVNKKVDKRATVRNRIKRHLREAIRANLKERDFKYMSMIFKAKPNAVNLNYENSLTSVNNLLTKIANKYI